MKQICIRPRCSGKTTILIDKFVDSFFKGNLSFFVTPLRRDYIYERIKEKYGNTLSLNKTEFMERIINPKDANFFLTGKRIKKLNFFVDEFLLFKKDMHDLYRHVNNYTAISCEEVNWLCYSTSDMLYNKTMINLVRYCKKENIPYNYINNEKMPNLLVDYHYNILTEPGFSISTINSRVSEYLTKTQIERGKISTEQLGCWLKK